MIDTWSGDDVFVMDCRIDLAILPRKGAVSPKVTEGEDTAQTLR